jgi:uncharacterized Rmd1/YagE family protein
MAALPIQNSQRISVHAISVGDRLNISGLDKQEMLSTAPAAFRVRPHGFAVLFRYGVIAFVGLKAEEETQVLIDLKSRISGEFEGYEEEFAEVERSDDPVDVVQPGGLIRVRTLAIDRLLLVADALAKSAVLAHDERRVDTVFDIIEPARTLAEHGRTPRNRRSILKLIGNALLVQQRVSGRVAVLEKPDSLWDKPELERLYARLEDEYERKERVEGLDRKLAIIGCQSAPKFDPVLEWAPRGGQDDLR